MQEAWGALTRGVRWGRAAGRSRHRHRTPRPPPPSRFRCSLGEAASDEDAAQRVLLAAHRDGRTDIQVAEGVKAGGPSKRDLPGHISKVGTLGEDGQGAPRPQKKGSVRRGSPALGMGLWGSWGNTEGLPCLCLLFTKPPCSLSNGQLKSEPITE